MVRAAPAGTYDIVARGNNLFYRIPEKRPAGRVLITLTSPQGKIVRSLVDLKTAPGVHALPIGDLAAGMYFVNMKAGEFNKTAAMVIAR